VVTVFEEINTFTPLGIRLWDPVFDRKIDDAISITATPVINPRKKIKATRTISGIYSFPHLPGMRDIEYEYDDHEITDSPVNRYEFVIEVTDERKRFIDVAFSVELPLPYSGVFLTNIPGSPTGNIPKGLHLYSSNTRKLPANMAAFRGELLQHDSRQPAAHALLRLQQESGESWYGIADKNGFYAIVFPYPELIKDLDSSPAGAMSGSLYDQSWELTLSVFYSPSTWQNLQGADTPNYLSILSQQAAGIWPQPASEGGSAISELPVTLQYQKATSIKTNGLSELLISSLS